MLSLTGQRVAWMLTFYVIALRHVACVPRWNLRPRDSRVLAGQNATLYCQIDGVGDSAVVWQKDVDILFINHERQLADRRYHITGDQASGQFNLLITTAERADDHTYRCSVGAARLLQDAKLDVIVPPGSPSININNTGDLTAGEVVSLTCSSTGGNPSPTVRWYRAGQLISGGSLQHRPASKKFGLTTSQLTWRLTGSDHNTAFTCAVENEGNTGNPFGASYRMNVQYGPVVSFQPSGIIQILVGESLILKCDVRANPPVSLVTWFKDGVLQKEVTLMYRINVMTRSRSSSVYECVASNKIGEGRNISTVTAIYPPVVTIPESDHNGQVLVNISTDVRLTCKVDAHPTPDVVSWRKVGSLSTIRGAALHLHDIQRSDAGLYICEATSTLNPTGGALSMVTRNASVFVQVQYPPGGALISQLTTGIILIGQDVRMNCSVKNLGYPAADIYWTKEGDPTFKVTGAELFLSSVKLAQNGVYVCVARNKISEGIPARYQLTVNEAVSFVAPFLETVKHVSVYDTGVSVMCEARGKPLPQVTWYKNGQPISATSTMYMVTSSDQAVDTHSHVVTSQLLWTGTSREPSANTLRPNDAANYTCVASNMAEFETSRNVEVVVYYPPIIHTPIAKFAVSIGQSLTLVCQGHSLPKPKVTWLKKDSVLDLKSTKVSSQSTRVGSAFKDQLAIRDIQSSDIGTYSCVASNYLGNTSVFITLTTKGVPEKPRSFTVQTVTWESARVQWKAGFNGGYPQTFIISYSSVSQPARQIHIKSSDITQYTVTGLIPSTVYTFMIWALNDLGQSAESYPLVISTKQFVISPPKDVSFNRNTNILTLTFATIDTCIKIIVAGNSFDWRVLEECATPSGGGLRLSLDSSVVHMNISACLKLRPDVCSRAVEARIDGAVLMEESMPVTLLIVIGCISGVVIVVLVVILALLCWRRKQSSGGASSVQSARPYHQAIITVESSETLHARDNHGLHIDRFCPEKICFNSNWQDHGNKGHLQDSGHLGHVIGKPPWNPRSVNNNTSSRIYSKTHSIEPHSGVHSKPSHNSHESALPIAVDRGPKPDTHSHSSEESGYSTPTKTKTIIREIVV